MTNRQQPDALEIASIAESADLAGYPTAKKANAYYLCLLEDCAQMIRRLHAENETLRASHGQAPAGAGEPTEQQILEAAFAPAQPAVEASRFGSPELQAMIIARCVEKDQADSVQEDAARLDWLALAGPTSICVVIDREHDGEVEVSTDDVTCYGKTLREALDKARKQGASHD